MADAAKKSNFLPWIIGTVALALTAGAVAFAIVKAKKVAEK